MTLYDEMLFKVTAIDFAGELFDGEHVSMGSSRADGSMKGIPYRQSGRDSCCHIHWCNDNTGYHWEAWPNYTEHGIQISLDLMDGDTVLKNWRPELIRGADLSDGAAVHSRFRRFSISLMQEIDAINKQNLDPDKYLEALKNIPYDARVARSFVAGSSVAFVNTQWCEALRVTNARSPFIFEPWSNFTAPGSTMALDIYDKDLNLVYQQEPRYVTNPEVGDGDSLYRIGEQCILRLADEVERCNQELIEETGEVLPWLDTQ
jgi:hypothetical protein